MPKDQTKLGKVLCLLFFVKVSSLPSSPHTDVIYFLSKKINDQLPPTQALGNTICHACDSNKWNRVILFYYFTFVAADEEADEDSDLAIFDGDDNYAVEPRKVGKKAKAQVIVASTQEDEKTPARKKAKVDGQASGNNSRRSNQLILIRLM